MANELSKDLTTFRGPTGGLYRYRYMPFGLVNAMAVWSRFIDTVMGRFLYQFVLCYADDVYTKKRPWVMKLEEFDLDIQYRKGTKSTNVDALAHRDYGHSPVQDEPTEPLYDETACLKLDGEDDGLMAMMRLGPTRKCPLWKAM